MSALLMRILIAVVAVLLVFTLLPPVFRVVGFSASTDVMLIFRVCIGGLALLYILAGSSPRWSS